MTNLPKQVRAVFDSPEIEKLRKRDGVWGTGIIIVVLVLPGTLLSLLLPFRGEAFLAIGLLVVLGMSMLLARLSGKKERRIFDKRMQEMGYDKAETERMWNEKKDEEASVEE